MKSLGIRKLRYEFGEYVIEEFDGASTWSNGDPVPRDKETLVIFLHRKNHEDYGLAEHSLPSFSTDNTVSL